MLWLDRRQIGEWRAYRFDPTPGGERLGLASTLGSRLAAFDYVLSRLTTLSDVDRRFARTYFSVAGRRPSPKRRIK